MPIMSETREFFESEFSDNPHSNNSPEFLHPRDLFDNGESITLVQYLERAHMSLGVLVELLVIAGLGEEMTNKILDFSKEIPLKFFQEQGGIRNTLYDVLEALHELGSVDEFKNQANVSESGSFSIHLPPDKLKERKKIFLGRSSFGRNPKKDTRET